MAKAFGIYCSEDVLGYLVKTKFKTLSLGQGIVPKVTQCIQKVHQNDKYFACVWAIL